jgi:hypothetical protein
MSENYNTKTTQIQDWIITINTPQQFQFINTPTMLCACTFSNIKTRIIKTKNNKTL